ncbi:hypothetical protein NM208_g4783 [Fusarium decemcellulare]|uniref:Uncharacterized protein n=1 Tax=Fusarium decemcellulare TaxID=57161 RepID=A0ACC1SJB6_9HYPO|nr:hypothetical protein NM208_g4783 [Fusarium decemcellulare]
MPVKFTKGNDQRRSLLFTKLLPEIRRLIFVELFGSSKRSLPGWLHCICKKGEDALPHPHNEHTHKWRYLSTNILFTCKWAYESGIAVLYGTNSLMFGQGQHEFLLPFKATVGKHFDLINKIELYGTIDPLEPFLGPKLLSYALAKTENNISVEVRYREDSSERWALRTPMQELAKAFDDLKFRRGTFIIFHLPLQLVKSGGLLDRRDDRVMFMFTGLTVDYDWKGPDSDDELYGFHVFPSRGDF